MLRLVVSAVVGALLVAPVGFGGSVSVGISAAARLLFALLLTFAASLTFAGAFWSRRWHV